MIVSYKGMECTLLESYMREGDGPWVMIINSSDINKAYENGFNCLGYPNEVAKRISMDEYNKLVIKNGKKRFEHI